MNAKEFQQCSIDCVKSWVRHSFLLAHHDTHGVSSLKALTSKEVWDPDKLSRIEIWILVKIFLNIFLRVWII